MVPQTPSLHQHLETGVCDDTEQLKALSNPLHNLDTCLCASVLACTVGHLAGLALEVGGDQAVLEDPSDNLLMHL